MTAAAVSARPARRPARPPHQACDDALADGTLIDPGQAATLAALAARLKWAGDDDGGAPSECHRAVRLFCGPDLDHDGDAEAIVEVAWWRTGNCAAAQKGDAGDGGDHDQVTKTFLASRHGAVWRAVAPLAVSIDQEAAAEPARRSFFVKRPHGEAAVRVEWTSATSDTGCALGGYEVFALRGGSLRKLEGGDLSQACTPCGCHDGPATR